MAALSITASDVKLQQGQVNFAANRLFGETVAAGSPVYLLNNEYMKAVNDSVAASTVVGLALMSGDDGDIALVVPDTSKLYVGTILTQGIYYYLGATAGTIVPYGDLLSGDYVTRIGFAESTSVLRVDLDATGVTIP